jgi:glutamine---fructose-6-phosphate transaminase (isomerizing)
MGAGETLEREIREQSEAVRRQLELGRGAAESVASTLRTRQPVAIIMAARGSSDNAARYAQYVFGAHNGKVVALATPSLFTLYQRPPSMKSCAAIGISQSGRSPDVVSVLREARRLGIPAIAVTNELDSPLAAAADEVLPLHAGEERAVAATKTYTVQLTAMAMISAALEGNPQRWDELSALPSFIETAIERGAQAAGQCQRYRHADRFVVIGRGFNYGTAMEISLKIKETSYVVADPYSSADFRHGPSAVLDATLPVVLIAPSGRVFNDVAELLDLCERRGSEVIAISDRESVLDRATSAFRVPGGIPEWLSPMVTVISGQWLALELARALGLDPDRPRGLSKVTETR